MGTWKSRQTHCYWQSSRQGSPFLGSGRLCVRCFSLARSQVHLEFQPPSGSPSNEAKSSLRSFESPFRRLNLARPLRAGLIRTEGKFDDGAKRGLFRGGSTERNCHDQGFRQCKSLDELDQCLALKPSLLTVRVLPFFDGTPCCLTLEVFISEVEMALLIIPPWRQESAMSAILATSILVERPPNLKRSALTSFPDPSCYSLVGPRVLHSGRIPEAILSFCYNGPPPERVAEIRPYQFQG